MNDGKNFFLAVFSGLATFAAGIDWLTVLSVFGLPVLFFIVGKYIDVRVQLYKWKKDRERLLREKNEDQ